MKQCTETVTVLNRRHNAETGRDDWIPTIIRGVSWFSEMKAAVTIDGLKTAKTATVRIPVDVNAGGRSYVEPAAYKAAGSVSGAYTLARGDILVRGEVQDTPTPAEVQAAFEDCVTIIGVTDNTRRPRGAHRKVVGA